MLSTRHKHCILANFKVKYYQVDREQIFTFIKTLVMNMMCFIELFVEYRRYQEYQVPWHLKYICAAFRLGIVFRQNA